MRYGVQRETFSYYIPKDGIRNGLAGRQSRAKSNDFENLYFILLSSLTSLINKKKA